jgi:F-type H+-transporting ATPase subunit a
MASLRLIVFALALWAPLSRGVAAELERSEAPRAGITAAVEPAEAPAHGEAAHEGLPQAAVPILEIGWFKVSNSMIVVWIVAVLLIVLAQAATRNVQLVPAGLQNFCEWLVEGMYGFFEEMVGPAFVKRSFWFFCTIFVLILFTNWFGLVPGVGTIGWGTHSTGQMVWPTFKHIDHPVLRGGNADLNMTSAMALIFFFLWIVWSVQELGVKGFFKHIFGGQGGGIFMAAIFFFVGLIEVISILFRPVSLSFRLYGNIFAGENILEAMMNLVPWLGWILPLPFYFLELLVGLVQALVFALLTAVFTALMTSGEHDHEPDEAHAKPHH